MEIDLPIGARLSRYRICCIELCLKKFLETDALSSVCETNQEGPKNTARCEERAFLWTSFHDLMTALPQAWRWGDAGEMLDPVPGVCGRGWTIC